MSISAGEILGLVGESGAGKSMTVAALSGLLDPPARVVSGKVWFEGRRIDGLAPKQLRALRGARIGWVAQNPAEALNPLATIGNSMLATLRAHRQIGRAAGLAFAEVLLDAVQLQEPKRCLQLYPHQLSGGTLQRIVIAMAIAHEPALLIADEPTSALDVTTQLQIIDLLRGLTQQHDLAVLIISHNIGLLGRICDRLGVIYAGSLIETGPVAAVLATPCHPYTRGLLSSVPRVLPGQPDLIPLPGEPPVLSDEPSGCAFHPRCDRRGAICELQRPPALRRERQEVSCWFPLEQPK